MPECEACSTPTTLSPLGKAVSYSNTSLTPCPAFNLTFQDTSPPFLAIATALPHFPVFEDSPASTPYALALAVAALPATAGDCVLLCPALTPSPPILRPLGVTISILSLSSSDTGTWSRTVSSTGPVCLVFVMISVRVKTLLSSLLKMPDCDLCTVAFGYATLIAGSTPRGNVKDSPDETRGKVA